MRDLFSKMLTGSMIASAALLVSACGTTEPANNAMANTEEMNSEDAMMNGMTNDMMTNTDGAMMNDSNMSNDGMMAGNNAMTNDSMSNGMANGANSM